MIILQEDLHNYVVYTEVHENLIGNPITMSFYNHAADLRFSMSIEKAKQLHETLGKVLERVSKED